MGLISILLGAGLGYVSLYIFPAVLVRWAWLRIALLFLSPAASGFLAAGMAARRRRRDGVTSPGFHFVIGLCFSIGFVWTRFALAHRRE